LPRFSVKPRSQEELAGLAHQLLEQWDAVDKYPIDIEHFLERHHGIKCLPSRQIPLLCDQGGAVSLDGTRIYLDPYDYSEPRQQFRLRMTIGHEFGHLRLHGTIFGMIRNEDDLEELLRFFTDDPASQKQYEIQAFTLAGYLLVPEETLSKVTKKVVADLNAVSRGKRGSDLDLTSEAVWKLIAQDVARKYEVTYQAVTKRLQWSSLWRTAL
jgi:Zn-dependent peptidase ImmA (M78 family)